MWECHLEFHKNLSILYFYDCGRSWSVLGDFGLQTASIFNQDNINDLFLINCNGFMILLTSITMYIHLYIDILVVMIYYMLPYKTGPASLPCVGRAEQRETWRGLEGLWIDTNWIQADRAGYLSGVAMSTSATLGNFHNNPSLTMILLMIDQIKCTVQCIPKRIMKILINISPLNHNYLWVLLTNITSIWQ